MGYAFSETPGLLTPGTPAPRFNVDVEGRYRFYFDALAGRYTVLGFLGGPDADLTAAAIEAAEAAGRLFDGDNASLLWINTDPRHQGRVKPDGWRVQVLSDYGCDVSRMFTLARQGRVGIEVSPAWVVLDPRLRVIKAEPLSAWREVFDFVESLPPATFAEGDADAPALTVPRVFEPEFCKALIDLYETGQSSESGFMRQTGGRELHVLDPALKRRRDVYITDVAMLKAVRARIQARLIPEILQAFNFAATRMERDLIACYDSETGGFFKPHRDNTSAGTLHRRFACTINLNAEDYEGGDLRFPEFGARTFRAPTGGAVVFSCSLMHEALPVTAGRRYAFLPFLYDEEGEQVRLAYLRQQG